MSTGDDWPHLLVSWMWQGVCRVDLEVSWIEDRENVERKVIKDHVQMKRHVYGKYRKGNPSCWPKQIIPTAWEMKLLWTRVLEDRQRDSHWAFSSCIKILAFLVQTNRIQSGDTRLSSFTLKRTLTKAQSINSRRRPRGDPCSYAGVHPLGQEECLKEEKETAFAFPNSFSTKLLVRL